MLSDRIIICLFVTYKIQRSINEKMSYIVIKNTSCCNLCETTSGEGPDPDLATGQADAQTGADGG